jgi:hypothetical protein
VVQWDYIGSALRRAISLAFELAAAERAVEGARVLAGQVRAGAFINSADGDLAPAALSALLATAAGRLRVVRAAIRQTANLAQLTAAHNEAPAERLPSDDPDVRLLEWTARDHAEHAEHAERERAAAKFLMSRAPKARNHRRPR